MNKFGEWHNTTLPVFPKETTLWQRICCVLGYHDPQPTFTGPHHPYPGTRTHDQCQHCGTLVYDVNWRGVR